MSKIYVPYPSALPDTLVKNHADGDAEIPLALAGKARHLFEMATGGPVEGDASPVVPTNPQSLYGHDHSGPPYGLALRHHLFGLDLFELASADWMNEVRYLDFGPSGEKLVLEGHLWVKPFAPVPDTPYSRGYVTVRARNTAATATTLTVRVRANTAPEKTIACSMSAATTIQEFRDQGYIDLIPGWNWIELTFESSSSVVTTRLLGLDVNQVKDRSH